MNAAAATPPAYAGRPGLGAVGYRAPRPPASAYLEALDRAREDYQYTEPPSAYAAALAVERRATRRTRHLSGLAAGAVLPLVLLVWLLLPRGSAAEISRYAGLGAGVVMAASDIAAAPTAVPAPAKAAPAPKRAPAAPAAPADGTRPVVAPRLGDYTVVAPPSISAARIDQVLASYGSPASGSGAVFYDLGVKYGIDPAYALAFYINESAAGTKGVARFTHGIGNIRTTPGYADYEGYRSYPDFATGIEDWYKLIKELYVDGWGLTTPDAIIARYAPWGDNNNPEAYAHTVEQLVDSWQG